MKSGSVSLGGIRYRLDVHEGMATFVEKDRMSCARITVQKCNAHELLYVRVESATGFVPDAHVRRAVAVSESLFGPNHYPSLKAMHLNVLRIAVSNIFRRPLMTMWRVPFWRYDVPHRIRCLWSAARHSYRLVAGDYAPQVEWDSAL